MEKYNIHTALYFKCFAIAFLSCLAFGGLAQEVTFTAEAPRVVSLGERFRLNYKSNAAGTTLRPGNLEGFSVLSGPNTSRSSSVEIVGNKMEQTIEISYSYILQAKQEGKFTITSGTLTVEGKKYDSNPVTIEVVKAQNPNQGRRNPNTGSRSNPSQSNPSSSTISNDDIFLRMLVSKKNVLKGEPVVATLKLYSRVNLSNLGGFKAPTFNGFWSETLREANNLNFQRENVNGQIYSTAVVQQHVLIPERTGELTIDPAELTTIVQVRVQGRRSRSLFDNFFGNHQNVEKLIKSPKLTLNVKGLPGRAPAGYADAVGKLSLSASLEPSETKTNEPVTLKVSYSGTGNLKLLSEPDIKFPTDFEVYDPKISNNFSASANGYSGNKTFEYLLIPRHEGDFEIPEIRFSVFDLDTKTYSSQTAGPFPIHVEKGAGGEMTAIDLGTIKEDVQMLGTDIRFIKTSEFELRQKDRPFFGSATFYLAYGLAIGLFFLLFLWLQKQRKRSEDVVFMKNRKAGRVAQSRLKIAKTFVDNGDRAAFYKEVITALWGYLSDKLNISQGKLDRLKAKEGLAAKNVEEDLVSKWLDLMDRCEYAQFAPGSGDEELSNVYDETAQLIGEFEKAL